MHAPVHLPGGGSAHVPLLRQLATRPGEAALRPRPGEAALRPWHHRELHNPWSRAAPGIDAWAVLALCTALARLPPVTALIGGDVILFDTVLLPDGWDAADQGPELFPVAPPAGLTILCAFDRATRIAFAGRQPPLDLAPGDLALVPAPLAWRAAGTVASQLFAARYFPATARYIRDPGDPAHRALMERLPLFNFATMPLWLVAGADRAGNDFVTGFAPRPPYWSAPPGQFAL